MANNKMREALKQVKELNDLWFDTFTLPDGATSIHDEIENVISAALAEPVRNCDRFATVDEAREAHEAICEKYGKCHHGCPLNNEENYSAFDCFEAWLFAPATEKEGGNDADK